MDMKVFWRTVTEKTEELSRSHQARLSRYHSSRDLADLEGQPEGGKFFFFASKHNDLTGMVGGRVTEMNIRLGAQRIVEGTHELASRAQIEGFTKLQKDNLAAVREIDARTQNRMSVTVAADPRVTR